MTTKAASEPQTFDSYTAAMAHVQANLPHIDKDSTATVRSDKGNYTYGYADLAHVSKALLPLLGRTGLVWTCLPTFEDGRMVLKYEMRHTSGESVGGVWPLAGGTPQAIGSAITYGRRYALMAVVGVFPGGEDDDGAAATQAVERNQRHAQREQERPVERGPLPPEQDPWATVEVARPPVVTDEKWKADITARIAGCEDMAVLRGLHAEVGGQVKAGKVSPDDAAELAALIEEQAADLTKQAERQPVQESLA